MTTEEKANEICKRHIFDSNLYDGCMEMAEWKDSQLKQYLEGRIKTAENCNAFTVKRLFESMTDKMMIEKACEWLKNNIISVSNDTCIYTASSHNIGKEDFIKEFRKAMEE